MNLNRQVIKCINDERGYVRAANDDYCFTDHKQLEKRLKCKNDDLIYLADSVNLKHVVKLAFKHQCVLYINKNTKYDFSNKYDSKQSKLENALILLSLAEEPILLNCAVDIVSDILKHHIPFKMSLCDAQRRLEQNINPNLDVKKALSQFSKKYQRHRKYIKKYIEPDANNNIKVVKLSYQFELLDYLKSHKGIFVLKSGMGSGKSKYGVSAYFEYLCRNSEYKPTILTPDIALSKQIVAEQDPRHYQSKNLPKNMTSLSGLVCCVNSATTNDKFFEYIKESSQVIFLEEFEESTLALTQQLIKTGKLSERGEAMARFFELLNKDKVIIADALFSDLSAKQVIEETNKNITIIENTDPVLTPKRSVTVMSRNVHFKQLINNIDEGSTEITFSDQGQKYSSKFFQSRDIVKTNAEKKRNSEVRTLIINSAFLKSKEGQVLINDFENRINEYDYIQISPSLTSGLNFDFKEITRVNLLAAKTILPTQLIQSSGRFRRVFEILLSFSQSQGIYHRDAEAIKFQELIETVNEDEYSDEVSVINNNPDVERVISRIQHNNFMRYHYENNSLIMLEHLGVEVKYDSQTKLVEKYQTNVTVDKLMTVKTLQANEYSHLKHQWEGLDEGQRNQLRKYETLTYFNVLNCEGLYRRVLEFDKFSTGRFKLNNIYLCRTNKSEKKLTALQRIKQKVFRKILDILKIDIHTFSGQYYKSEILELEKFIAHGTIELDNSVIDIQSIDKSIFKFKSATYEKKGSLVSDILKNNFGLEQISNRSRIQGKRVWRYEICPLSIKNIEELYLLVYR
ncbi:hypothetical protein ACNSN2_05105 [Pseudoalteromonas sp. US3C1013]|uniref:hypothetical protein n=1 Tax=unclassified Pseudoalteromonas TaxID=194690 RepID=UPI003AB8392E